MIGAVLHHYLPLADELERPAAPQLEPPEGALLDEELPPLAGAQHVEDA